MSRQEVRHWEVGVKAPALRLWQTQATEIYFSRPAQDFTVTATPGAGKTTFALNLAQILLSKREITRVIVVAPTDHLRSQWATAAQQFGIRLDAKLGNNAKVKPNTDGYVTTYAQVASHPLLHERRTETPNRTLVIFDEIHHAGDGLSWGDAVREAFAPAARRLALTGTPFRTSTEERIPFVAYSEDADGNLRSTADYTYGYSEALSDHVVRPVMFAAYSGSASWVNNAGDLLSADLAQPETKKQEQTAWRAILDPDGDWVRRVVTAASDRVEELRLSGVSDAGCLILASDQEQARAYAKIVKKVTGATPVVVLSDDVNASKKIDAYNSSKDKFLVAVRMVSEGVDIRRLCVLVWLTSYQTPLFFAQAVGRVVRARNPHETATVFLPSVRPLVALAATLEQARDHVLRKKTDKDEVADLLAEAQERNDEETQNLDGVAKTIQAEARFDQVLVSGRAIGAPSSSYTAAAEEAGEYMGLPGLLSEEQAALLLAQKELEKSRNKAKPDATPTVPAALSSEDLRQEIALLVKRWAYRQQMPMGKAHMLVRNAVPGPKNSEAKTEILAQRRDWLLARTT